MNIKHILLSSDDTQKFYSFWPSVSYHWNSMEKIVNFHRIVFFYL